MKNQPKFVVQPPCFKIHSLMVFPFEKCLTDNLNNYGITDNVTFHENVLLDIVKKLVPTVSFSTTTNAAPYFQNKS